jgi:hypothetical protein
MKRIAMLLSTAALAAGLVVAAGGTAQAAPGGCTTWTSGNKGRYGNGKCTSGSGEYRLHGRCNIPLAPDPYFTTDWVRVGQTATGDCRDLGVDYTAHDLYLEFR